MESSKLQRQLNRIPLFVRIPLLIPAIGLPIYWGMTFSGPYRWLAEWQVGMFGSYEIFLTGAILLLVIVLICVGLMYLAAHLYGPPSPISESTDRIELRQERIEIWIRLHMWRLIGATTTISLIGTAVYLLTLGLSRGQLTRLDVGNLESGGAPASLYVELSGKLRFDDEVVIEQSSTGATTQNHYIPLVSDQWQSKTPVKVYLEIRGNRLDQDRQRLQSGPFRGTLFANALPGLAITFFEKSHGTKLNNYWVCSYQDSPKQYLELAWFLGIIGMIFALITIAGWVIVARKQRKI